MNSDRIGNILFFSKFELIICIIQTEKIKMNIPKSGWIKSTKVMEENKIKFNKSEKSFLDLYLPSSRALRITNVGFKISVGWKEKLNTLIHLLAPFISGKKSIAEIDRRIETKKKISKKL